MRPEARKLAWDAAQAAAKISRFVEGRTFAEYLSNELLRSGVERQFEIIGEALGRLARVDPDTAGTMPQLTRIVAFRNLLIHGYASIDDEIVWGVVEAHLPGLQQCLDGLLEGTTEEGAEPLSQA